MFDTIYAQNNSDPSVILTYVPVILMGLILYFILLRPEIKKRKKFEEESQSLKKGDLIITRGGLLGKISDFKGKDKDKIILITGDNTKITILKSYYSQKYDKST